MADNNEWELSKENIKPLKGGRCINEVMLALKQDQTYKTTIQEFEMQLRILEDEELLNKWFDYVCWVEQRCISSNHEALNLMKRCVKHFKDKHEFKDNDKYVRIWIKISELTEQPNDIFNYMLDQDIGTSLAMFYKAWAVHNELIGHKKKADEIFILGINRNADPVDVLKKRHSEFEWRMMKTPLDPGGDEDIDDNVETRSALNQLPSSKSGRVSSYRATKVKTRTPLKVVSATDRNRKCSSTSIFEIFDDAATNKLLPNSVGKSKLKNMPFDSDRENVGRLEKMHGTKVKSSVSVFEETPFEIYKDTFEEEPSGVFVPVNITSREPLKSITSQVAETNMDILQDLEKDSNDAKSISMYPKSKVYMGVSEVSLEELKSQLPQYKKPI